MNYTIPPKKMLILNILDVLRKYSDENHRLSAKDIGVLLEREYAQKADRKAIKRNLMNLLDFGYEIEYSETTRTNKNGEEETICSDWYLVREFTDAELRLLIDSLLFSKTVPYSQCRQMIEKLEGLSNSYFKAKVKHIRGLPENQPENRQVFYTIDVLDEAISQGKCVAFFYNDYGIDKKLHPRTDSGGRPKQYEASPYQMAATNGRYYLICKSADYDDVSHFRIDRITHIRILDKPITPLKSLEGYKNGLDLPRHMAENLYMFSGAGVPVKLRAKRYIIKDILDWFGYDVHLVEDGADSVIAHVRANEQAMFYWAMQYGEHVEVLSPEGLRVRIREAARSMAGKYM